MPSIRQRFHLSPCSDFRSHFCPSSNVHQFIWVKDVDALYEDLVQRGADITLQPTTQPYGIRECAVTDLNGVKVVFGQDDELYHGE